MSAKMHGGDENARREKVRQVGLTQKPIILKYSAQEWLVSLEPLLICNLVEKMKYEERHEWCFMNQSALALQPD